MHRHDECLTLFQQAHVLCRRASSCHTVDGAREQIAEDLLVSLGVFAGDDKMQTGCLQSIVHVLNGLCHVVGVGGKRLAVAAK